MSRYQGVCLDKNLIARVDKAVAEDPFILSRAEYVRRAIQRFLQESNKK